MKFSELRAKLRPARPGHSHTEPRDHEPLLVTWRLNDGRWHADLHTERCGVDSYAATQRAALDALARLVAYCPHEFGLEPED